MRLTNCTLFVLFFSLSLTLYAEVCLREDLQNSLAAFGENKDITPTLTTFNRLEEFAKDNELPVQYLDLGPDKRKAKRMFVAIDMNNDELVKKYLNTFSFDDVENPTLALEFQHEVVDNYVTGVLRTSSDPEAQIYRWGRKELSRDTWVEQYLKAGDREREVWGYSHLIGLSAEEASNVRVYLDNPRMRGRCKADNCVAWTSSIELGKTADGVIDQDRRYLFNELGVSRSSAHFEIGRRLIHAADQRHSAVVVFVNGEKGVEAFKKKLPDLLPPEPKIPYHNIISGLGHDPKGDLMQAVSEIPDGSKIYFPIAAGASPDAMSGLIQNSNGLNKGYDITILVNGISESALREGTAVPGNKVRYNAHFIGGNARKLHAEGKVDYIPGYLSDFPRFMEDPNMTDFNYDAIVVRVSPPDINGNYSLGPNYDSIMSVIKSNPNIKIIAEVNENIPFTTGDNFIRKEQITASFNSSSELAGPPVVPLSDVDAIIGKHLGELIDSGSSLQVGIGNIFGGLPDGLSGAGKGNIKISTEMFGDPLKEVMKRGIAQEAETGFAYGSVDLYKWMDRNPSIKMVDTLTVNSPGKVAETPNFHAVNTALQVRLSGDVNAEMGPLGRLSSPGGQVEFMSGAARSQGGKSIIAIRSTAKNDTISTITTDLYNGHITTPSESVNYIVTEYGVAMLKGKSTWQKAINLINIAHPKFRVELMEQAIAKGIISKEQAKAIQINPN